MTLNPSRPFFGIFALFVVVYAIFVLLTNDPLTRINRICTPVISWPERVAVAAAGVFDKSEVPNLQATFGDGFQNCRRLAFGVLYKPALERYRAQQAARATPVAPGVAPSTSASSRVRGDHQ